MEFLRLKQVGGWEQQWLHARWDLGAWTSGHRAHIDTSLKRTEAKGCARNATTECPNAKGQSYATEHGGRS
jgi:uncharacterized membrane protein